MLSNLSKSKVFLICCLIFIAGIALASWLPWRWIIHDLWWFIGIVASVVGLVIFWKKADKDKKKKKGGQPAVRFIFLFLLFFFLGLWRYAIALPTDTLDKVWHYNGQAVTARGVICAEPDIRFKNQKLEICSQTIALKALAGSKAQDVRGKILVTTNLYPVFNYNDEVEITCELKAPERFRGFAYDRYLARYDVYSVCYYPKIYFLSETNGNGNKTGLAKMFYKKIYGFKNKLRDKINYGLPEPAASLANAIILGYKKNIPEDLRQTFSQAGLSHIVAISGLHISIIAALVMGLLLGLGLPRGKSFWIASCFLLIYIILIGLPASAMRAGLMGFLVLLAMNLGRINKLTNSLVLAAVALLFINPKLLRDDIGFQLSFLAVLGIAYFYPILDNWSSRFIERIKNLLRPLGAAGDGAEALGKVVFSIFNITMAAQIFILPILAFNFSQVSLVAPLSNLLVLWTLPLLMATILSGLILSALFPGLAFLFFLPAFLLLKYIIVIAEWLVKLPYAYFEVDYLWWGWAAVYYVLVVLVIFRFRPNYKSTNLPQIHKY